VAPATVLPAPRPRRKAEDELKQKEIMISASIGIAMGGSIWNPAPDQSEDQAMYPAKLLGRNSGTDRCGTENTHDGTSFRLKGSEITP